MTSIAVEELFGRNLETSRAPNPWPAPSTQETEPFEMFGKGAGSFFDGIYLKLKIYFFKSFYFIFQTSRPPTRKTKKM